VTGPAERSRGRPELPIERAFPVERVNELVEREGRAKQWYRPIYTMHKWWARRSGCLFRAITLYTLLDGDVSPADVAVRRPDEDRADASAALLTAAGDVDPADPEPLWAFYPEDVRIDGKRILDPFAGGGTSLVEASRFGVDAVGVDLNPVAWFVTKKELDAGHTDVATLEAAFDRVEDAVAEELAALYRTPCPNGDHDADVMYVFWVRVVDCPACDRSVPLFDDYRIAAGRYDHADEYNVRCPDCGAVTLVDDWRAESDCDACGHAFVPADGPADGGRVRCPDCGTSTGITDVMGADGADSRPYAVEYYCPTCDDRGRDRSAVKGYRRAVAADERSYEAASRAWHEADDLREYAPDGSIPAGATTLVDDDVAYDGHDLFDHGIASWADLFNDRQRYALATLLRAIDRIEDRNAREYLLLAFSETLNYNTTMTSYNPGKNLIANVFNTNGFNPPKRPVENNVWGTAYGTGTFTAMWEMVVRGVEYASAPTDRYVEDGESRETDGFASPVGPGAEVRQGDMRSLDAEDEFDAVITDPPYYDNVIYSELSDFFYVWQRLLLADEYDCFAPERTPRADSLVTNPYLDKTAADFEHEMGEALRVVERALKPDGTLAFTYHHSDADSWGELLASLCENGFEVTATYPVNSDPNKFSRAAAASFDAVIVARPATDRRATSWNALRRRIGRAAAETRAALGARDLNDGDVGVVEMGACFRAYSRHHGRVHRAGDRMSAKAVVDEIYGILRGDDRGPPTVYLDLLAADDPTVDDLRPRLDRTGVDGAAMRAMGLYRTDGDAVVPLGWRDDPRRAYVRHAVGDGDAAPTDLDRAQFLRARFEREGAPSDHLDRWRSTDLLALCEGLAEATGDDAYLRAVGLDPDVPFVDGRVAGSTASGR
jgi:adenine-specific DNA methylase